MQENNQTNPNAIQEALENKVLGTSSLVSSAQTGVDKVISSIKESQEAGAERISGSFGREEEDLRRRITEGEKIQGRRQRGVGINTQFTALSRLREDTDKSLKDLADRKREALRINDTSAIQQIAELEFKAIEFQQKAEQQVFENQIAVGQFGIGLKALEEDIKKENRLASASEVSAKLDRERFDFQKISTVADRVLAQQRINIQERELKILEAKEGKDVKPDPGFGDLTSQNVIGSLVNEALDRVSTKIDKREIKEEEQEATLISEFMEIRRFSSKDQVSDDKLAELFGLRFDSEGELGVIREEVTADDVPLPGEVSATLPRGKDTLRGLGAPGQSFADFLRESTDVKDPFGSLLQGFKQ